MSILEKIIIGYVLAINLVTLIMYGIDKLEAKHSKWRIPEATLLIFAAVGGSVGALCGMKLFYHKTLHKKFKMWHICHVVGSNSNNTIHLP